MKKKKSIGVRHLKAATDFLDQRQSTFRRSDISEVMYPLTSPRSRPAAEALADAAIQALFKTGRIVRHGHLHWKTVEATRTLLSGRKIPELPATAYLSLQTRSPQKWVCFDLETGDVWAGSAGGWRRAPSELLIETGDCIAAVMETTNKKSKGGAA